MPVMTEGVYGPASQEELDAMHQRLQQLDPSQDGVTLDKLRTFYPKTPWGEIIVTLRGLREAGRAKSKMAGKPVQFENWTWQ